MRAQNRRNPAYPAMLAHDWNKKGQPDPKGWWASEKYDGLRALWDGENFYSRNGKIFHAPQWFKDTLPSTPLDGELWGERSVAGFQKAVSAVRKKVGGKEWENITYMVFDIPTSKEPFEKVQAKLKRMDLGPYGAVAPQYKVKSKSDMLRHFDKAVREGAEGIMLRKPSSKYSPTRSASLLKVKPTDSSEAVVTGYQAGTGKHRGRMGAVHVYLLGDKSKVFKIGTGFSDRERESPPPIGSIVEFKFNDKTARGIPRFPAFLRIRTDMMADRPKRKAAKPARKKTMAKKFKWPDYGGVNWDTFDQDEGDGAFYFREVYGLPGGRVKLYVSAKENKDGTATVSMEGREKLKLKFPSPAAAAKWLYKVADSQDDPTRTKPKREKAKREAKGKPKATKPTRKKTMAKKKDREGLYDPKHYWARRVKKKYTYRGGESQYPEKVGDWTTEETWSDGIAHGNAVYETENATFDHPSGGNASIYHRSGPKGETWQVSAISGDKKRAGRVSDRPYDSLKDALAALKLTGGRKRKAAPKKRTARKAPPSKSRRTAAYYFSMGSADLVSLGDAGAKKELKRRGRDPRTGKKVRR